MYNRFALRFAGEKEGREMGEVTFGHLARSLSGDPPKAYQN
jgi:hypothetical protein